jgi:superfamily II helicase
VIVNHSQTSEVREVSELGSILLRADSFKELTAEARRTAELLQVYAVALASASTCARCRGMPSFDVHVHAPRFNCCRPGHCVLCRRVAASMLVRRVRRALADPAVDLCRRRLLREIGELNVVRAESESESESFSQRVPDSLE